jgi:hypothetical protein
MKSWKICYLQRNFLSQTKCENLLSFDSVLGGFCAMALDLVGFSDQVHVRFGNVESTGEAMGKDCSPFSSALGRFQATALITLGRISNSRF